MIQGIFPPYYNYREKPDCLEDTVLLQEIIYYHPRKEKLYRSQSTNNLQIQDCNEHLYLEDSKSKQYHPKQKRAYHLHEVLSKTYGYGPL
ncbi:Uncharacterised protein [Segatella copri]|nr:Uncharacterised protein [Segatella copri]